MNVKALALRHTRAAFLALALLLGAAPAANAASGDPWDGNWHSSFLFYGWLPGMTLDARVELPSGVGKTESDGNIYDNLAGALMFSGDFRKGDWGFFYDAAWVKFDDQDGHFTDIGGDHINGNFGLKYNFKGGAVTLAGLYALAHGPGGNTDVVFGGRYLWTKTNIKWDFTLTGQGGLIDIADSGKIARNSHLSDFIVGLRGNWIFGDGHWYVPYYIDVGTGDSDLTTSANLGIGYLFDWGSIAFVWRDLRYKQDDDSDVLHRLALDGPSFSIGWQF